MHGATLQKWDASKIQAVSCLASTLGCLRGPAPHVYQEHGPLHAKWPQALMSGSQLENITKLTPGTTQAFLDDFVM